MNRRPAVPSPIACAALLVALCAAPASAATITGVVRNEALAPLSNVDLDFIDLCSGDNIFLSGDKTAADGSFGVVVPAGTYDVHFTPPAGSVVCAGDLQDVVVSANASLGTITLHPGTLVSGVVLTPALAPAAGVDLKFVDRATDHRVYLTKDVTNASGQYSVRVPPGSYDVDFRPPTALPYADAERLGLAVGASPVSGLSDALRAGFNVTGQARDRNSNRIKNLDVDVFDECSGRRIATAHDNTDANGNYSIWVPAGTYTFSFDPPLCKSLASSRTTGVTISQNKGLGTEQLDAATLVTGVVHGPDGQPVENAKLRFYDATQAGTPRQATANDRTDASGAFGILLPAGTFDLDVDPPPGVSDLVARVAGIVTGPANLGTITLAPGLAVHGRVLGPGGVPVVHANVNAVDSSTRASQRLANDTTGDDGRFTVVVAPGTYDFQYDLPACGGLAPASQADVAVAGATALPDIAAVVGVHVTGTVVDGASLPVANVDLDLYPAGSSQKLYTPNDQTAADGTYDVLVAPGALDVRYIPSSLTRLRPGLRTGVTAATSIALPLTVLDAGWIVTGFVRAQDTLLPLAGAAVDFFPPGNTTSPLWTVHHLTAVDGSYAVVVPSGTYDVRFSPPAGAPYGVAWSSGVGVVADLALTDRLLPTAVTGVGDGPARGGLALSAPRPNPASGGCAFTVVVPAGEGELSIWNVAGRRVARPWSGVAPAGRLVRWDGRGNDGTDLPPGLYYARLAGPDGAVRTSAIVRIR